MVTGLVDSEITAKYSSAQWVQEFFGLDVATLIPVSQAHYWTDEGQFFVYWFLIFPATIDRAR